MTSRRLLLLLLLLPLVANTVHAQFQDDGEDDLDKETATTDDNMAGEKQTEEEESEAVICPPESCLSRRVNQEAALVKLVELTDPHDNHVQTGIIAARCSSCNAQLWADGPEKVLLSCFECEQHHEESDEEESAGEGCSRNETERHYRVSSGYFDIVDMQPREPPTALSPRQTQCRASKHNS